MTKPYTGTIHIFHMIDGAKQATSMTVIIDVFRAFSLEPTLYGLGAGLIRPVGTIEEAFSFRERFPDCLLIGERKGRKCEGFDFGNSPSSVTEHAPEIAGKLLIHTTSAGTQGIVSATGAEELLTGSFLNAKAIAAYIKTKNPPVVSLVCMGNSGVRPAKEDELCAEYLKALLLEEPFPGLEERLAALQFDGGDHFFDPNNQEVYPEPDFWMCIKHDLYPFVIRVERDDLGFVSKRIDV